MIRKVAKGKYMLDVRINGVRQRTILPHVKNKQQAEVAAMKEQQKLFDNKYKSNETPKSIPTLKDFFETVYVPYQRNLNKRSIDNEIYRFNKVIEYFGDSMLLDEMSIEKIKGFKDFELTRKISEDKYQTKESINKKLILISGIYTVAVKEKVLKERPIPSLGDFKFPKSLGRKVYLQDKDEPKLFSMFYGRRKYLKAACLIAVDCCPRRGEIQTLRWEYVRFDINQIGLTETKTDEPRWIPMSEDVRQALWELKQKAKSEWVFPSPRDSSKHIKYWRKAFKAACEDAGVSELTFHDLRRTGATRLNDEGVGIRNIQEILGHNDPRTTERYIYVTDKAKQNAINKLTERRKRKAVESEQDENNKLVNEKLELVA